MGKKPQIVERLEAIISVSPQNTDIRYCLICKLVFTRNHFVCTISKTRHLSSKTNTLSTITENAKLHTPTLITDADCNLVCQLGADLRGRYP